MSSSDMFMFDEPYYPNLPTSMISPDEISGHFFTDPISALSDSSIDSILHDFSDDHNNNTNNTNNTSNNNNNSNSNFTTTSVAATTQISVDEAAVHSFDQIAHTLLSNSPPSHQLETLSLQQQQQQTHMGSLGNVFNDSSHTTSANNNHNNYAVVSDSIKSEDFQVGFDYPPSSYNSTYFLNNNNNNSYDGNESMLKFMQRSYSSNSFEPNNNKPSFWFQPKFNTLLEVQNFQPEIDSSLCNGQMRRVCSTGDLPVGRVCSSSASPLSGNGEGNMMEESNNFKVGKYSAEERKERIDRYRAKRTQRNFNKTIKYACRKTLADNRPRIRGRFARNDETGEIPKPTCFNRYEEDDDLWVDNLQEEDEEGILGRGGGRFLSNFGATQFQYCGY